MLKCKKILLSLLLCITLFSVSCFATTMTENEIKSSFNENVSEFYNSSLDTSVVSSLNTVATTYFTNNNVSLSDNYLKYVYYLDDTYYLVYWDFGDNVIESCNYYSYFSLHTDDFVPFYEFTSNGLGNSDTDMEIAIYGEVLFNTFDTVFTYSSDSIFAEPSSPSPSPSGIFAGILATMTYILASITIVMNSLVQVDLILFVILASLCISIIYFVVKLLKGFTGNKLVSGKKRK